VAHPRVLGKHHKSEFASCWNSPMAGTYKAPSIDEYLRKRLMPVEGAIPHVQGIEMYGNSIPAGTVGGDATRQVSASRAGKVYRRGFVSTRLAATLLADGAPCFDLCACPALVIKRDCSYISIHFSLEIAEISLPIAWSGKSSGDSK